VDGLVGPERTSRGCSDKFSFPITFPGSISDPDYPPIYQLSLTTPQENHPFGTLVTSPLTGTFYFEDGSVLGKVVGHYWFPRNWDLCTWPRYAERDPANGVQDENYFFFPDPTFQRILLKDLSDRIDENGTSNAWFNRMISQWLLILRRFSQ